MYLGHPFPDTLEDAFARRFMISDKDLIVVRLYIYMKTRCQYVVNTFKR